MLNKLKENRYDLKLEEFKRYTSLLEELNQIEAIDKRLNIKIDELIEKWKLVASDDFQKYSKTLTDLKNRIDDDKEKMCDHEKFVQVTNQKCVNCSFF